MDYIAFIKKDNFGHILYVQDANGNKIEYKYDSLGYIVFYTDRNGYTTRYNYGNAGLLTEIIGPDGKTFVKNEYDTEGRVLKQIDGEGNITKFKYELVPNTPISSKTTVIYPDGTKKIYKNKNTLPTEVSVGKAKVKYKYDANNRVSEVIDPYGNKWKYEYYISLYLINFIDYY